MPSNAGGRPKKLRAPAGRAPVLKSAQVWSLPRGESCDTSASSSPNASSLGSLHDARTPVFMAHAGASWRTPANQPAPAPARQAAAAPDLVEQVTARAHHRVMTDMESRYSRENGRLPSRLLPCEFFDNSITAMVRQLLAAKGKNQLSRTKDIELHFFYNPATNAVPQAELQVHAWWRGWRGWRGWRRVPVGGAGGGGCTRCLTLTQRRRGRPRISCVTRPSRDHLALTLRRSSWSSSTRARE